VEKKKKKKKKKKNVFRVKDEFHTILAKYYKSKS